MRLEQVGGRNIPLTPWIIGGIWICFSSPFCCIIPILGSRNQPVVAGMRIGMWIRMWIRVLIMASKLHRLHSR